LFRYVLEIYISQNIKAINDYLWVDGVFPNCEKVPLRKIKKHRVSIILRSTTKILLHLELI